MHSYFHILRKKNYHSFSSDYSCIIPEFQKWDIGNMVCVTVAGFRCSGVQPAPEIPALFQHGFRKYKGYVISTTWKCSFEVFYEARRSGKWGEENLEES